MFRISSFVVAVCAVICASHPVDKLPVLKALPYSSIDFGIPDEKLILDCATVDNNPDVKYSWLKDGEPFVPRSDVIQQENEGTLVFEKPIESDQGQYQCLAHTEYGVASSRVITVKKVFVDVPPVVLKKHKPVEGKTYKLECPIPKAYPPLDVVWTRKSLKDPTDNDVVFSQRYTISDEGTLYFSNITKEDANPDYKYVCITKSAAVKELIVLAEHVFEGVGPDHGPVDHDVIEQYVSNDKTVKAGDQTYIYCIYGGNPLAHPDWFKDGKDVNNGPKDRVTRHNKSVGKRLIIKEIWVSDQGEYTCNVDNEVGKPQKHSMYLTVVSSPQFLKTEASKVIVKPGQDIKLPCIAAGIPAPALTWTYNAEKLIENDRILVGRGTEGNTTIADLTIKNVQGSDKGYYGCRALNENGDVYSETLLYVQ